jgi:hypothetical protein
MRNIDSTLDPGTHKRVVTAGLWIRKLRVIVRNSDDSDQPFQRIPISHSDRSRSGWRECAVGCIF